LSVEAKQEVCTSVTWKSNKYCVFWVCVGNLSYPGRNEHAPFCHLRPARLWYCNWYWCIY